MKFSPVPLLRHSAALAECPCWHPGEQALYFTDIPAGKIWRFDPATGHARIFHEGEITGGLTLQEDGGWLLFRKQDVARLDSRGRLEKHWPVHLPEALSFNDVTADSSGRVFAGTKGAEAQSGGLYLFDLDGTWRCLFQGTGISNGMAFSICGSYFYWTCTTSGIIYRFNYAPETGAISNRECFYRCESTEGLPDGLTVDREGNLWSARWGTGSVVILSPQGKKLDRIDFPESNITSVTWGGAELKDLYVTAARQDGAPGIHDLFVIPGAGQGLPESRSRLTSVDIALERKPDRVSTFFELKA